VDYVPDEGRKSLAGMASVLAGSVCVHYDSVSQTAWLSSQPHFSDVEDHANVVTVHVLDLDTQGWLHFGPVLFSTLTVYCWHIFR
jgi:hypothetical protein